ncbi:DUF1345 domain-containing protein [Ferrovibrio sp.]|uniref:DUF1345 domain-containing protein n=1 Tax=Ferrovibrio sp. TaxID=1917215 RepID=UPI003D11B0D0
MAPIPFLHTMPAAQRLLLAAALGLAAYLFPLASLDTGLRLISAWIAGSGAYLLLCWIAMQGVTPAALRRRAQALDGRGALVMLLIVAAAIASMAALGFLVLQKEQQQGAALALRLGLGVAGMVLAWLLIHVVFAMHYAHLFYGDDKATQDPDDMKGGLDFPGREKPDYGDFLYFSFVVGMTCQVSDVQVTGRHMRRLTLLHGILSFFFNTAILALSINMVAGAV